MFLFATLTLTQPFHYAFISNILWAYQTTLIDYTLSLIREKALKPKIFDSLIEVFDSVAPSQSFSNLKKKKTHKNKTLKKSPYY